MRALGIDIGGSSVKAAFIEADAIRTARSMCYERPSRAALAEAIRAAIGELVELGAEIDPTVPIGLCLPGRQGPDGGHVTHSLNLPCLEGWSFDAILELVLGHPPGHTRVISDIHAAGVDLVRSMDLRGRVAVIAIGTGVGLGVWERGQMLTIGDRGIGHLGQLDVGPMDDTDRFAADGARNTLESYIGLPALRAGLDIQSEAELCARLASLDLDEPALIALVRSLRMVHAIYVPDTIVLAGGVGIAMAPLGCVLHERVSDGLTSMARPGWSLRFGDSLYHASLGAARLALG